MHTITDPVDARLDVLTNLNADTAERLLRGDHIESIALACGVEPKVVMRRYGRARRKLPELPKVVFGHGVLTTFAHTIYSDIRVGYVSINQELFTA